MLDKSFGGTFRPEESLFAYVGSRRGQFSESGNSVRMYPISVPILYPKAGRNQAKSRQAGKSEKPGGCLSVPFIIRLEARVGIELTNKVFPDLSQFLTTLLLHRCTGLLVLPNAHQTRRFDIVFRPSRLTYITRQFGSLLAVEKTIQSAYARVHVPLAEW